ncbi:hypothetical protein QUA35_15210 [Microcoleus sp. N9_B2]|uniref:hypothetical protein n=1 Tax=unclassified Microcoleus TaxID=2642155 RepID=UPI002FD6567B
MVKNFEQTLINANAKLNLYLIGLMLKRLANEYIPNGFYKTPSVNNCEVLSLFGEVLPATAVD